MRTLKYGKHTDIKWQESWEKNGIYKFSRENIDNKLYCLEMFSYPSGAKLHVGHWWNFGLTDSWARVKRMQGHSVFHPMGFDAFGLPAENYAIKTGIHPLDSTMANIATMREQLRTMGGTFDWDHEVVTCLPSYYRWTQWLFLKLHEHGLAYRKEAPVNWCPSCNTSLANEQVEHGACERCNAEVTKRNLTQWFFKITAYADDLLTGHEEINWPEKTKAMQKNWIGKSTGATIIFPLEHQAGTIEVFTTRADTLFGCTYLVLAPEHPLVNAVVREPFGEQVANYQEQTKKQSEIDRLATTKEKTGVFTGSHAYHPATGERIAIWIADYVLATYGTGAVMAVPGHDARDYDFATKYQLPIVRVVQGKDGCADSLPFVADGIVVGSSAFDGLTSEQARIAIVEHLHSQNGHAHFTTTYRLRDWLVSRQRYWGAPIPIIYCDDCGVVPVPASDLPVLLPYNVDFTPDGQSPLAKSAEFVNVPCPKCHKQAKRETDTLDTFVDSSWYFLRYPDNKNNDQPWDIDWINRLLPVDMYVGGPEHAVMHLLYARFIVKALKDMGYVNFGEPFKSLVHQGIILGADGEKMSKSKGNVVSPDAYIDKYGADVFRLYLLFGFNYLEGGPWSDDGIKATARYVERVERVVERAIEGMNHAGESMGGAEQELNYVLHRAIHGITQDVLDFGFNTCVSKLMELTNALYRYDMEAPTKNGPFVRHVTENFVRLLAPFAPHLAEELWATLGHANSVHAETWPQHDPKALSRDRIQLAVQVNGRLRDKIEVESDANEEAVKALALQAEKVLPFLVNSTVRKIIVVKGSLVNIVLG
ncbi:MAG: Leucine--tRNA ligase [Firmicutes bacterium]|nr:Leucine--tRNA ligase [Bacillota bacterium]